MSNNVQASAVSQTSAGVNARNALENRIQNSTVVGNSKSAMSVCNKAVNSLGQTVRPIRASNSNTSLRPVAIVPPEISKTSTRETITPDMEHLNEQIKQAKMKQLQRQHTENLRFQQNNAQGQHSKQHPIQSPSNNPTRHLTTANSVQQRTQQVSISPQKQQMQQKSITSPPPSEHNAHVSSTNMEVDSLESMQEKIHLMQQFSPQSEHESSSSESVAYLQKIISDPSTAIVQHQIKGNEAKMLVMLSSGEQRLITFEIPNEDCTVHDLLDQVRAVLGQVCLYSVKDVYI